MVVSEWVCVYVRVVVVVVWDESECCYLDKDDVCAGFSEGNGHCCAYASGCACDEGGLSLEGEESLVCCHCDLNVFASVCVKSCSTKVKCR